MALKLPTLATWQGTVGRWAAELKRIAFLTLATTFLKKWDPQHTQPGVMSYASIAHNGAFYIQIGYIVFVTIAATGTTGGVAGPFLTSFSLPVPPVTDALEGGVANFWGFTRDGGGPQGAIGYLSSSGRVTVQKSTGTNYGLGTARTFQVSGFYIARTPAIE